MSHSSQDAPRDILLFYDGFERKAVDRFYGNLYSTLRGTARYLYRTARNRQPYTGYYTAFMNVVSSLKAAGHKVHMNRFDLARARPDHPIGLCGYRSIYDKIRLPNPAFIFHAEFGLPGTVLQTVGGVNARMFSLGCQWACDLYRSELGGDIRPLFVGIDTNQWPDLSRQPKTCDYIVYDKLRWHRDTMVPRLLDPVLARLEAAGASHVYLRYGAHHVDQFRKALRDCRAMIFLCEHETQGLAYQEAMSSGVPVLAWDEGVLVDPQRKALLPVDSAVSSVPYFDERCGLKFQVDQFDARFAEFSARLETLRPRDYVLDTIGLAQGAEEFLKLYDEVGRT